MFTRLPRFALAALCIMALSLITDAAAKVAPDAAATVREISTDGIEADFPKTKPTAPKVIATADELAAAFKSKEVIERLKKEVDLKTHDLIYFAWSGSGQDRIASSIVENDGKREVVFTYSPGRTRDLRSHIRLFAVAKDVKWRVATAGR